MANRRALLSLSDKSGLAAFARRLAELDFELVSTGGTAGLLESEGIPVTRVSEVTGAPEILGGRVKTLHPTIHGGILGRPDLDSDRADMEANGIAPFELVAVNLYPFRETIAKEGVTLAEAIEKIDIGGPTMVRAAAKNHAHLLVVVDPADYDRVAEALASGEASRELRYELAAKAFAHTAAYDAAICNYLTAREGPEAESQRFPATLAETWEKVQDLRYGENPHQSAAFYARPGVAGEPVVAAAEQLHGKALSYNNLLDADAALEVVKEFEEPCAVVVKHLNPCGVAIGPDQDFSKTYLDARACDPISAFGGVVALNREVDAATAEALAETFLEIIIAPAFSEEARARLSRKKDLRLLALPGLAGGSFPRGGTELRAVGGGVLVQDRNVRTFDPAKGALGFEVVTERAPTESEIVALRFAWRCCKHVKSNAIVYASDRQLVGVGAGQMSRLDSAKIAASRAALSLEGCVAASDAFFPFRDGLDTCAEAGATAVIQPGGSKKDQEVIDAANERGLAMVFTGTRHFRH
ncbi:MAG: bifunctional phosphoribosylaminoimidazolecarboxamide formyltransferase/IMP cyclohydrolase [Deltaproteobacteria bacterium]|nr:bifunctional phosphoribosylaminoimidazolecarboxamide formyltransferase/IMP cyclohydrolase [Deltaproteobacteria bacterium]